MSQEAMLKDPSEKLTQKTVNYLQAFVLIVSIVGVIGKVYWDVSDHGKRLIKQDERLDKQDEILRQQSIANSQIRTDMEVMKVINKNVDREVQSISGKVDDVYKLILDDKNKNP